MKATQRIRATVLLSTLLVLAWLVTPTTAQCQWSESFKLLDPNAREGDIFGAAVAVSGNIAVVGAPLDNEVNEDTGSASTFDVRTGRRVVKLISTDHIMGGRLGGSVAISGTTAILGGQDGRLDAAYVFDSLNGEQLHKLLPSDLEPGRGFGSSVAIRGNLAVVGAPFYPDQQGRLIGAAYVFDVRTGEQIFKIIADDGDHLDRFGASVAATDNLAIIGAPYDDDHAADSGSVYIFDLTTGQLLRKLTATNGGISDQLGISVASDGSIVVAGAHFDDERGSSAGAAYVFNAMTGEQVFKLLAQDAEPGDHFGTSVALSGNTAVIGAPWDDDLQREHGSAYLFDVTSGSQIAKLLPAGGIGNDEFGGSVGIDGHVAIIGARFDDERFDNSGSAYLWRCGPSLTVRGTCPSGGPIEISWSGATANGQIALIFAANTGSFRVPNGNPCAGTPLDLGSSQIQLAFQGGAGSNGSRTLNSTAGPNACGGYLQLLDISSCGTSNVARIE